MTTTGQVFTVDLEVSPEFAAQIGPDLLERAVRAAFAAAGRACSGELTIAVTGEEQVRRLNRDYRGVDAPTDVLAFGEMRDRDAFVTPPGDVLYLGDVVISYPRAVEQAAEYVHPLDDELVILVIHGVLHLLGYDHETPTDKEDMWRVQERALEELGIRWEA